MPAPGGNQPLVAVGVPVFNEEANLPAVLDSLLAQDYERLQIIVCDNGSTDGTLAVAEEYAARDGRIEVHGSDENRGATFNFNRCFELARADYFTWASGHDVRMPEAIRRCVEALQGDPGLVLCYPSSVWRRHDGTAEPVLDDGIDTSGLPAPLRLRRTIERLQNCNAVHGVIRSEALAATRLFRSCVGSDHVVLAELSLRGEFRQLEDVLFIRVENRPRETADEQRVARTLEMLGVDRSARAKPFTHMGIEHVRGVWHASHGVGKLTNTARTVFWYSRRWRLRLAAENLPVAILRARTTLRQRLNFS